MEQLLESNVAVAGEEKGSPFWSNPAVWLREKNLSREFWVFFVAAFFFDFGFSVYFFLFNLYLLDLHFNERAIGLIGGAMGVGSLIGTLPAGLLARRFGLRPLLIVCFVAAPALCALRCISGWEPAQIGLAVLAGLAMCLWGVCFLPTVARLTTEKNRASAFSLIFSVSIGSSALGGLVCGYLPQWLARAGFAMQAAEVKRLILLASCGIVLLGLFAVMRMKFPASTEQRKNAKTPEGRRWLRLLIVDPFLLRFLPAMALWTVVVTAFTPFANVYLSRELHVPLSQIGVVFSVSRIVQLCLGLLTPLLFRALGLVNGIAAAQILTAISLACLAGTQHTGMAIAMYLSFSAMQWMTSPGSTTS